MDSDGVEVQLVIPPAPMSTPSVAAPPRPSRVPDLPRTGSDVLAVVLLAVALIAVGALLVRNSLFPRRSS